MKGIIIIVLLGMVACQKQAKPENLIDPKTLVDILTEIHLAEAKVQNIGYRSQDSTYFVFYNLEEEIFKKYHVSKKDYDSSYAYYIRKPKEFNEIYEKTIDSLTVRQAKNVKL